MIGFVISVVLSTVVSGGLVVATTATTVVVNVAFAVVRMGYNFACSSRRSSSPPPPRLPSQLLLPEPDSAPRSHPSSEGGLG